MAGKMNFDSEMKFDMNKMMSHSEEILSKAADIFSKIPGIEVEKLTKRNRIPKEIKCKHSGECPQKRDLSEDESDEELSPVQKLRKLCGDYYSPSSPSNISSDQVEGIGPLDDRSIVSQKCFSPSPGPSFDMPETSNIVRNKNIQPTSKKLGFLGLGTVGQRMVKSLIHSGHDVSIWNRTPDKCKQFVDYGAQQYLTPAEVVLNCDIIFCCVSSSEAVESIVFGAGGVLEGLENCQPGTKGYVEMTFIDPIFSLEISEAIALKGGKYLEAPIASFSCQTEEDPLMFLVAGDHDLFKDCESCFSFFSKNVLYLCYIVGTAANMSMLFKYQMIGTLAALTQLMEKIEKPDPSNDVNLEVMRILNVLLSSPLENESLQEIFQESLVSTKGLERGFNTW